MTFHVDFGEVWGNPDLAGERRARAFAAPGAPDAILTFDPVHVTYLTGYASMSSDMNRNYRIAALATAQSVRLIVSSGDGPAALECLGDPAAIHRYGTFHVVTDGPGGLADCPAPVADFDAAVVAALAQWSAPSGAVLGLDGGAQSAPPGRATVEAGAFLRQLRRVKLPHEVALIERALSLMENGISAALDLAAPGVSERSLAAVIAAEITRGGGVPRSVAVTSGRRSANVDAFPSDRILQSGDVLRIDLGASFRGYWGDMARSAFIGAPSPDQRRAFEAISAGVEAQRRAIRPGATATQVFQAAVQATRAAGLPGFARHHCGHGLGLNISEAPLLAPDDDSPLEAGMVLAIETPYYHEGQGGMMTEDVVLVTAEGSRPLTHLPRDLRICPAPSEPAAEVSPC